MVTNIGEIKLLEIDLPKSISSVNSNVDIVKTTVKKSTDYLDSEESNINMKLNRAISLIELNINNTLEINKSLDFLSQYVKEITQSYYFDNAILNLSNSQIRDNFGDEEFQKQLTNYITIQKIDKQFSNDIISLLSSGKYYVLKDAINYNFIVGLYFRAAYKITGNQKYNNSAKFYFEYVLSENKKLKPAFGNDNRVEINNKIISSLIEYEDM